MAKELNSLLLSNETQSFRFNVRFTEDPESQFDLVLFDQKELSPSQKAKADLLRARDRLNYFITDFSRPVSMEILYPVGSLDYLQQVDRLGTILLFPGSIRELEEEGAKLNESSKEPKTTQTVCFWSNKFKVNERKIDAISDYASAEDLHCVSLPNKDSGLKLNLKFPKIQNFQSSQSLERSIQIVLNPKTIATYELVMKLNYLRSVEDAFRFVQDELKNPTANFVQLEEKGVRPRLCMPWFYEKLFGRYLTGCKTNDRPITIVFGSNSSFSNETMRFASETCNGWEEKNGLFRSQKRQIEVVNFIPLMPNGWPLTNPYCPFAVNIKRPSFPVNGELWLSTDDVPFQIPITGSIYNKIRVSPTLSVISGSPVCSHDLFTNETNCNTDVVFEN